MNLWTTLESTMSSLTVITGSNRFNVEYLLNDSSFLIITSIYAKLQLLVDHADGLLVSLVLIVISPFNHTVSQSLIISLKFLILVALLIFIRGGIPRYRFDHLTKIGWIKYLSLVLASMLIQFMLIWVA